MNLESRTLDDFLVIAVRESRIDASVAIQFKDGMRDLTCAADDGIPDRIILDLSEVEFIDSSGLGAVVAAMKQLPPDRRLELAALTPAVAKVFRLTRMDSVFLIHDAINPAPTEH